MKHLLSRAGEHTLDLDSIRAEDLKSAARYWVGPEANKFHKQQCATALHKAFQQQAAAARGLAGLSELDRQVLSIYARYGPTMSGALLMAELHARGLMEKPDPKQPYAKLKHSSAIGELCRKLILIGGDRCYYGYGFHGLGYDRSYPEMTLHPAIVKTVEPAAPVPWKGSGSPPAVKASVRRSSAEVAVDLWQVSEALRQMGDWSTVRGDALAKGSQNRLRKLVPLPSAETDPMSPPDLESLYYELLHELGFLDLDAQPKHVIDKLLDGFLQQPAAVQAWQWTRAWMNMRLWQDGIGLVPDRDNAYEPVRIGPEDLYKARQLLLWALCRVAHGPNDWLDLESFLKDLWHTTEDDGISFYWHGFAWDPKYEMARRKNDFPAGADRSLAFWLDQEGVWASNAVMVTLVTLGLVERGQSAEKRSRPCFRLTDLGRAVFGAPEVTSSTAAGDGQFLTLQPNHEIVVSLDAADARQICTLARFARRADSATGPVQTFVLSRDSVYRAMQSGMTVDAIRSFLIEHGKHELPDNVGRSLSDWAGRRESLVLRVGVSIAVAPQPIELPASRSAGRVLADGAVMLPRLSLAQASKEFSGWQILDHEGRLPTSCTAHELGQISVSRANSIALARLAHVAERCGDGWQISADSVSRARQFGITADQILRWLSQHLEGPIPPLLQTAVSNWAGRASAFFGKVYMLQIPRPQARDAILTSPVFQPLLAGHIPPDWFIVRDDQAAEAKRLLKQLGFTLSDCYQLPSPSESERGQEDPQKVVRRIRRKLRRLE